MYTVVQNSVKDDHGFQRYYARFVGALGQTGNGELMFSFCKIIVSPSFANLMAPCTLILYHYMTRFNSLFCGVSILIWLFSVCQLHIIADIDVEVIVKLL
jgi:hypothetical protein